MDADGDVIGLQVIAPAVFNSCRSVLHGGRVRLGGNTATMDASVGTKLKQEISSNYKSFDNPSELPDDRPTNGFACDSNKNHGEMNQHNEAIFI